MDGFTRVRAMFFIINTWTKTSVDGGLVCTEMFVVWLLFTTFCTFSLLDFSCLDVFMLKCFCEPPCFQILHDH